MITIRYPNGQAVTYNDAGYLLHGDGGWILSTKSPEKGGRKLVFIQASAGVTVEFVTPCKVETVTLSVAKAAEILARQPDELRRLPIGTLCELKRVLADFSANTKRWLK